jgi:hypothetical protein
MWHWQLQVRAITWHNLTQYCQGPSLLYHAQRGILPMKRSHEVMLSGSYPTTFQQQIKNFNSLNVNVSIPTINTLHGLPSLLHFLSKNLNWKT